MEEMEDPTEKIQEEIHERAQHETHSGHGPGWISKVALTSALLAALAAVTSLLSGHHSNEAMLEQLQASDQWNYYQAKGIKASTLASKLDLLAALHQKASEKDQYKLVEYRKGQEEISEKAKELETSSHQHLRSHVVFSRGVTMFQIAIAIAAISVLTRRKRYYFVSLAFGAAGVLFLVQGLVMASHG